MSGDALGMFGAAWNALVGRSIEHFPRHTVSDSRLEVRQTFQDIKEALPANTPSISAAASLSEHCRETLNEVKELTEYQDQKATRLLTIVAFLSALSGVLFSRLTEAYPLRVLVQSDLAYTQIALLVSAYTCFALFATFSIFGALVIFHATRTIFKYPARRLIDGVAKPSSVLFYEGILSGSPSEWAKMFSTDTENGRTWDGEVREKYIRAYIAESYLVAAKVADKLRYLQPGQRLLLTAIRFLLAFVITFGLVIAFVSPKRERLNTGTSGATELKILQASPSEGSSNPTPATGVVATDKSDAPAVSPQAGEKDEKKPKGIDPHSTSSPPNSAAVPESRLQPKSADHK